MEIKDLRCNYSRNPIGLSDPVPRLSWKLDSDRNGARQIAYRIIASSTLQLLAENNGDLWDSGVIPKDQSVEIRWLGGVSLGSRQKCWWKVRVEDELSVWTEWSEAAYFEMGLLHASDWKARWIEFPGKNPNMLPAVPDPAPLFRKTFVLSQVPANGRAYVCGLGYFELKVNGTKVGDEVLAPPVTDYEKTVIYCVYDVTDYLKPGENVIAMVLGNGWYNCFTSDVWNYQQARWRHTPKLIFQLEIENADGSAVIVPSDTGWRVERGPIVFDGLRNGEIYDARLEKTGWDEPNFDDSAWPVARIAKAPGGRLETSLLPSIKIIGEIKPVSFTEVSPGNYVYDLGQEISGWARLRVSAPEGTPITIKYSEMTDDLGDIDTSAIDYLIKSGEFQTDQYITKGSGLEIWEPRFTYHGFRYIKLCNYPGRPSPDTVTGIVVHTALNDAGSFECSSEVLNQIQHCARWSALTNYHGIPTDCPHREKNGWTGDALLSAEQVLLNFDPICAYEKWLRDFLDAQRGSGQLPGIIPTGGWGYNWGSGPAWDSAVILIPWYMYVYSGDNNVLEKMYECMSLYIQFLESMDDRGIVDFGLGDWCPPGENASDYKCPTAVTDTAYYYVDLATMAKIAGVLGREAEAEQFSVKAERVRNSFRDRFFDAGTGTVAGNCQTSLACALYQGLIDENEKSKVVSNLLKEVERQNGHLDTGILGSKYLLHSLSAAGETQTAFNIATSVDYPGWGNWIARGATTLWERWDGKKSRNHHMFSDISAWFYLWLAGIQPDPDKPGFKHIVLRPCPVSGLDRVKASHVSPYGKIESEWAVEGDTFTAGFSIPVNCDATLYIPRGFSREVSVRPSEGFGWEEGRPIELGSGHYEVLGKKAGKGS
jgi:alpha-L-rhamnosidase